MTAQIRPGDLCQERARRGPEPGGSTVADGSTAPAPPAEGYCDLVAQCCSPAGHEGAHFLYWSTAAERGPAGACPPYASEGRAGPPGSNGDGRTGLSADRGNPGPAVSTTGDVTICDHCDQRRPDQYGLSTPDGSEYGFCSTSCFALFVRERFMETRA